MNFITELKKLGLNDKEAAVYLSCLQLGPSPVQAVARRSKVVRATTYVILESLMKMGLVTRFKEGKKTLFAAEPPGQLMRLLEKKQERLQEQQHQVADLLPELHVLMKSAEGSPTVRYFEGIEGLKAIRREMMMYSKPGDMWYNFTPIDYLEAVIGVEEDRRYLRQRVAKRIRARTIFTSKSQERAKAILTGPDSAWTERRFVSSAVFPSPSGMTIFRDRIAIGSFTGKIGGVIIESPSMSDMMRRLFELAWLGADLVDKK